jgi:hypothetical protein
MRFEIAVGLALLSTIGAFALMDAMTGDCNTCVSPKSDLAESLLYLGFFVVALGVVPGLLRRRRERHLRS